MGTPLFDPRAERTVLLVDPLHARRERQLHLLRQEGYHALGAEGLGDAISLSLQPGIQLALVEQELPQISGITLLRRLRLLCPNVCRILMAHESHAAQAQHALDDGDAYRLIQRPCDDALVKMTVFFAFESLALQAANQRLLSVLGRQLDFVRKLETQFRPTAAKSTAE
jgi:response regulator RpfG family c-di-GMP phosphodiesterase